MPKSFNPILKALAAAALFGAAAPAGKILLQGLDPFRLAGFLYVGAALAMTPFVMGGKDEKSLAGLTRANKLRLAGALICGGIAAPVCLLVGLTLASAASVSLWLCLEAIFTTLLAFFLFKEHLGKLGFLGCAGTIAAAVLLSMGEGASGARAGAFVGLACLLWGVDNNLTALIDGITPTRVTFLKGIVAGSINLLLGFLFHHELPALGTIGGALLTGALSYGLSLTLYISAAQGMGATRSQMIFAAAPFFGVFLSALFLSEAIAPLQAGAAALLIGSLTMLFRDNHEHAHEHEYMAHVHMHSHDDGHHLHEHPGEPASLKHSHWHEHEPITHTHPHWPDLHHRHGHHHEESP